MPFYEYKCLKHGRFEIRQPMFDKRKASCPICGEPAERRFSPFLIRNASPFTVFSHDGEVLHYQKDSWDDMPPAGDIAREMVKEA